MRLPLYVTLWVALLAGCPAKHVGQTTTPVVKPHVERPAMGRRMKLAVLPVESEQFPRVARGLNGVFQDVRMKGIDDYFLSRVTLEVVQLSIECVEPNSACYAAVGHSLGA